MTRHGVGMAEFEVGGRKYTLVNIDELNFREQRELKALSGMPLAVFGDALGAADADAWWAVLMVSMRRVEPRGVNHEAILADANFTAIVKGLGEAASDAGDDDNPPAPAPVEGADN